MIRFSVVISSISSLRCLHLLRYVSSPASQFAPCLFSNIVHLVIVIHVYAALMFSFSVSLPLSASLSDWAHFVVRFLLSVLCQSVWLTVCLSVCLVCMSVFLSVSLPLSLSLWFCGSICVSPLVALHLSLSLSSCPSVPTYQSVSLTIPLFCHSLSNPCFLKGYLAKLWNQWEVLPAGARPPQRTKQKTLAKIPNISDKGPKLQKHPLKMVLRVDRPFPPKNTNRILVRLLLCGNSWA